ncbi:hypothetical protein WA556_003840, partial [Blastocystis sp. ATCC 50177/Nand II]
MVLYPPQDAIVQTLLGLKGIVTTQVYAKVLSCLCGQCRKESCVRRIVEAFPLETVSSLITSCEGEPAIVRTLFLIYAFIMERTDMPATERDQILDKATEYLDRHGDNLSLLEAYILLVIPAYNGNFTALSRRVAVKLEEALQFSEQSDVVERWITTLLSSYFGGLPEESYAFYLQQSHLLFIHLHDNPLDAAVLRRCTQSLRVYCLSPYLLNHIITVDSMAILVRALRLNIRADSPAVAQIASLFQSILSGNASTIGYFLDNHGLDCITENLDCCSRVEDVLDLYDVMILVFREVSPSQLPMFSIDVFRTIDRFNENTKLITKAMTILSLFNCLEADEMEKKLDKLNSYLLGAMSSHSYYLVSVIVYILSKLELDDRAMRLLESRHFVANVDSFVMEFAEKDDGSGHRVKNNEHFTNIVYYMLGFFHDHIANNYVVDALDLRMVLRWVRMYACDLGIVSLFVELFSAYLQSSYYHVTSEEELAVVALLLDLFCVYADNTLPTVALQASILSTLMNLFSGYHTVICQAFLQPSFRATLAALLSHIFRLSCCLHNLDATATPAAPARDTKT